MIRIYDVLQWLRTFDDFSIFEHSYCGKLDSKKEKALGVYPLRRSGKPYRAFQGLESYDKTSVSLLIHFNKNVTETQEAAFKIFNYLHTLHVHELADVNGHEVIHIDLLSSEPEFVGTDNNGIYEFVIEFELYTKKGD